LKKSAATTPTLLQKMTFSAGLSSQRILPKETRLRLRQQAAITRNFLERLVERVRGEILYVLPNQYAVTV
jgi:hypothetical protein